MAKPTRVSFAATAINSVTTPKTISGVAVQAGDLVVVKSGSENGNSVASTPTATGYTFALKGTAGSSSSEAEANIWYATAPATENISVSLAVSGGGRWAMSVSVWRGHGGIGPNVFANDANNSTTQPLGSLTTTAPNSAIDSVVVDWNASGTAPSFINLGGSDTVVQESGGGVDSGIYSIYFWHNTDAGAAGAKGPGLNSPNMRWAMVNVEILGTASTPSGTATEQINLTDTAAGTRQSRGSATDQADFTDSAAGSRMSFGSASETLNFSDSAMGSAPGLGPNIGGATETLSFSDTAAGTRASSGSATDQINFTDTAAGVRIAKGSATETIEFSEQATGKFSPFGFASETIEFTDSATGPESPGTTVYLGEDEIKNIYLGTQKVLHRYKGEDQVF